MKGILFFLTCTILVPMDIELVPGFGLPPSPRPHLPCIYSMYTNNHKHMICMYIYTTHTHTMHSDPLPPAFELFGRFHGSYICVYTCPHAHMYQQNICCDQSMSPDAVKQKRLCLQRLSVLARSAHNVLLVSPARDCNTLPHAAT